MDYNRKIRQAKDLLDDMINNPVKYFEQELIDDYNDSLNDSVCDSDFCHAFMKVKRKQNSYTFEDYLNDYAEEFVMNHEVYLELEEAIESAEQLFGEIETLTEDGK